MKSIKPGRGPSMMSAIGSVAAGLFGVFWTGLALSMGAGFMAVFGVIFIIIAVAGAVYNLKNATGKNRFSEYDITNSTEEPDPLNERFGGDGPDKTGEAASAYCPYCGSPVQQGFAFCNRCGKKLP
jgi:hypothetical protein